MCTELFAQAENVIREIFSRQDIVVRHIVIELFCNYSWCVNDIYLCIFGLIRGVCSHYHCYRKWAGVSIGMTSAC